ncbi:hypothetical protein BBJ28_00020471 [Nothophytophthora sp. Chile5]|nr:hypothetical protein BBJ28_00020471 [Nothophytophthora sp. Chile5]
MGKAAIAEPAEVAPVPGFFGHVVAPGQPLKWANEVEEFCMQLNSAALGAEVAAGRSTLYVVAKTSKIALCTLTPQATEQWNLTQTFTPLDGEIAFVVDGPNAIHLTGFIEVQDEEDSGDEHDFDDANDDDDDEEMMVFGGDESSEDEDDGEEEEEEEEELNDEATKNRFEVLEERVHIHKDDPAAKKAKSPKKEVAAKKEAPAKKEVSAKKEVAATAKASEEKESAKKKAKAAAAKEKEQKTAKKIAELTATTTNSKKRAAPSESVDVPKKAKIASRVHKGVNIEETAVGKGRIVQKGRKVSILYRGRLTNGKQFDASQNRKKPFTFRHGIGDVIKGMDYGIEGMRAGGKRLITIPSRLGYGRSGAPPTIPGNADLVFEIEML